MDETDDPPAAQVPHGPGPMHRRGPRPLMLHLSRAMMTSSGWPAGWPNWSGDWTGALPTELPGHDQGAVRTLIAGIAAYRRHPFRRDLPEAPILWREGGSRLLDYPASPGGTKPTLLLVPSLVNRAYVLDLMPGRSMARFLAHSGVRTLLLDWGWPGRAERSFTLTDYVAGRLERAIAAAVRASSGPVVLGGYCMGGLLAIAAAQRRPDLVRGLALLATPWDFHADEPDRARRLAALLPIFEPLLAATGSLPVDALQTLFALLEPDGVAAKYRAFAAVDPTSEQARLFVALEDWLNDGVPLAAPVARECMAGWYGDNTPGRGRWAIAGLPVDPAALRLPTLVATPARDRIVPPESARPLAELIPGARLLTPSAGHIGMAAGRSAERELWLPLLAWLAELAGGTQVAPRSGRTYVRRKPAIKGTPKTWTTSSS